LRSRHGVKAAAEYKKILDHCGFDVVNVFFPLSQLGMARTYVMQGDTAKARTAYQDFFALGEGADPDVPVLKQAKTEYGKLQQFNHSALRTAGVIRSGGFPAQIVLDLILLQR
jgi:hypothetical protein